ncbi:MAG: hypothetical protein ERJ67_04215 [Aphanocapsa feldmannii 277cV]|uniref:Metal-binding protein n=2 Tax=Aphanocapsa feldmannii TaxID=192050 RepID=A0A524RP68_9CHRO|nr:MAG: hypothetical protein ERJ69_01785 [Aphanocapsa feldmannii 288cV]TGG93145.1 MAG: hypothetical protein ERJ67_04215 [Aphanocapsa feldmannii 277cV]TGH21557.1 MAG: hypothetical protein ERJ68_05360 [Aphanocapsa feldmannii 277cI]
MSSGHQHDRGTVILALGVGLGLTWWSLPVALTGGLAILIGGLWLSPDLDLVSRPLRRWGLLAPLWWPYRRCIPHRSPLSHGPLIGMTLRLLYLGSWIALAWGLLHVLGLSGPPSLKPLQQLWLEQRPLCLAALLGLEASSWLHLVMDGDPLPRWMRR